MALLTEDVEWDDREGWPGVRKLYSGQRGVSEWWDAFRRVGGEVLDIEIENITPATESRVSALRIGDLPVLRRPGFRVQGPRLVRLLAQGRQGPAGPALLGQGGGGRGRGGRLMHELAVAQAIVAAAERHAEGLPISVVRVRIGRLRQVVPEYLGFYFEVASEGDPVRGGRARVGARSLAAALLRLRGRVGPGAAAGAHRRRAGRPLPLP